MSSPIYKPVSQNGHSEKDVDNSQKHQEMEKADKETECGFLKIKPPFIQPCARIGCFTGWYSAAALITSTLSVYVNSQITTLERQFGFNSSQTGIIMASNDVGYLICVLFVSYSASRLHIPRSLGIATMIFGMSGIACSLPHFIFGARVDPAYLVSNMTLSNAGTQKSQKAALYGDLCSSQNETESACEILARQKAESTDVITPENVATASLAIIFVGMMLQGFGKAPRYAFTVTYIDDNTSQVNTGFYMGIITTLGILGPGLAFIMGGVFTRMFVTLESTSLTPRHPKWIGAWWLGYLVFGISALIISLPLFWFPRRLPPKMKSTSKNGKSKTNGAKHNVNDHKAVDGVAHKETMQKEPIGSHHKPTDFNHSEQQHKQYKKFSLKFFYHHAKNFLATLFRLWTNPIYVCMVLSSCFVIFFVSGVSAYTPKYLERMFNLTAFKANYIMAGKSLFAACVGTFIGGYLSRRLKMTPMMALKFVIIVVSISLLTSALGFVFQCDQPEVHNWPGEQLSCDNECSCEDNSFFPICGGDGKTYYSPCTAGCLEVEMGVYSNCTCIPGGTAHSGMCDYSCDQLIPYVVVSCLRSLFGTLSIIPKLIVFIRCVANSDKSLAIGCSSFMTSLFGWLLGPIIFGHVIDGICTIWDINCDIRGRCLLYDNNLFRLKLHGYSTVALGCSFSFLVIAYVYARCTGCLYEESEKSKTKKDIQNVSLVVNGGGVSMNENEARDSQDVEDDNKNGFADGSDVEKGKDELNKSKV